MIASAKRLLAAGAVASVVTFGSVGGVSAQAGAAARPDTPLVAYRKSVMHQLVAQIASLRAILTGDMPASHLRKHTEAVLANATMVGALFPESSKGESSSALSEIWARPADFKARMQALVDAARALDAAGQDGEKALAMAHLQVLIGTCGGCHSNFRLPSPLPPELMQPL